MQARVTASRHFRDCWHIRTNLNLRTGRRNWKFISDTVQLPRFSNNTTSWFKGTGTWTFSTLSTSRCVIEEGKYHVRSHVEKIYSLIWIIAENQGIKTDKIVLGIAQCDVTPHLFRLTRRIVSHEKPYHGVTVYGHNTLMRRTTCIILLKVNFQ